MNKIIMVWNLIKFLHLLIGKLVLNKIIINNNLLKILTDEPDNFIFDSLKEGIPSFFVIILIFEL